MEILLLNLKNRKSILTIAALLFFSFSYSQTTIRSQGFDAAATDNWNAVEYPNASFQTPMDKSISGTRSLRIRNRNAGSAIGNPNSQSRMEFDNVNLQGITNVHLKFHLSMGNPGGANSPDKNEDLWVDFSTDQGATWSTEGGNSIRLLDPKNATTDNFEYNQNYNVGHNVVEQGNPVDLNIGTLFSDPDNFMFRFRYSCNGQQESDYFYVEDIKLEGVINYGYEIYAVQNFPIFDGDVNPSTVQQTNFGSVELNAPAATRTYTIRNLGIQTLNLTGSTPVVMVDNNQFTITSQPSDVSLTTGQSTTFTVAFDPDATLTYFDTVQIDMDNPFTPVFDYVVRGGGKQTFPDTDGDGISDNIDQDDDNDGILDGAEQNNCVIVSTSKIVTTEFLKETFGQGNFQGRINDNNPDVTTSYCFEDGTTLQAPDECDSNKDLRDGKYTLTTSAQGVASWAPVYWHQGGDHTGDTDGRMALFNADFNPGEFYKTEIDGVIANVPVTYSFWALNLDTDEAPCLDGCPGGQTWDDNPRLRPRVRVEFRDTANNLIATLSTGDIAPTDKDNLAGDWYEYSQTFTPTVSKFTVTFINDQPGGLGNDLALDDILITQDLCDLDGDGVADVIDIDNDNDGIPNIIEIGLPVGLAVADPDGNALATGDLNWVDINMNGVHDLYESHTPVDTDGDGIPDYLDLDSDNDGIFDVLENDGYGDLDVNGNGIGEGSDLLNAIYDDIEDGDGLLNPIDNNDVDTDSDDHGTFSYVLPIDSDSDGIPDYLDLDSNDPLNDLSNGSDIDNSYYADQDGNDDGMVDATADVDRDGVYDGNNDFDTGLYGAPIDLDRELSIYFDGRNDYLKSSSKLTAGLNSATLMAWIIVKDNGSSAATILGEDDLEFKLRSTGHVEAVAKDSNGNVYTLQTVDPLAKDVWMNISAIYNGTEFKLFVNGKEIAVTATNGFALSNASTNNFTIGNSSDPNDNAYFTGFIDEVRVFAYGLNETDMRRTMYQEIEQNGTYVTGKTLPRDITGITWANVLAYYDFAVIKGDQVFDASGGNTLQLFNVKKIVPQTAPIPYLTAQDGSLNDDNTYLFTDVWKAQDLSDYDYSIVKVSHDVTLDNTIETMGMVIDAVGKVEVKDGNYLGNDWYMILNGDMDLEDDAQLLQSESSELDNTSSGKLLRRQQGEKDVFSYNYWSSPVGAINSTSNNNNFSLDMLEDIDGPVQFTGIGTGTPPSTSPVTISGRWLYTFVNGVTYNDWSRVTPGTTQIPAGYAWSQKGTSNTLGELEYIFKGKPNNGEILIPAIPDAGGGNTSSLLGNPYPSALDVREFIDDNLGVIDGAIYIWDQFRGTNHQLAYYEGGYATISKLATVKAAQYDGLGHLNGGAGPAIQPTFFLPVSQGFFVTVTGNGSISFNNSQRVFKQESLNESIFLAAPGSNPAAVDRSSYQDMNVKLIRLELSADSGASRQIAIGFDSSLTDGYDYGYDAYLSGSLNETDMYVPSNGGKFIIKALDDIAIDKVVDIAVKGVTSKLYKIAISDMTNIDANQDLWLRDNELNIYHDIKAGDYTFNLTQNGIDENRFDLVFDNPTTLSNDQFDTQNVSVFLDNNSSTLFINGLESDLEALNIYDLSGKLISSFRESELETPQSGIEIPQVSTGIYLVSMSINNTIQTVKLAVN